MDFSRFTTITFDCYGTLIDWEAGILPTLRSVLANHGCKIPDSEILELYRESRSCSRSESGAYQNYKEVLRSVVHAFGARLKITRVQRRSTRSLNR